MELRYMLILLFLRVSVYKFVSLYTPPYISQKKSESITFAFGKEVTKVDTAPLNRRGNSCLRSPHAERFAGSCGDPNIDGLFSIFLFQILS